MPSRPLWTGGEVPGTGSRSAPVTMEAGSLAELATAVWRLRNKIESTPGLPAAVHRHLQAVVDALSECGVTTRSYEGTVFDPGLRLRVLAYQPMAGLERDEVVETVRPAVHLHGVPITLGEVIVGVPQEDEPGGPAGKGSEEG
jgi:hypothetical protein